MIWFKLFVSLFESFMIVNFCCRMLEFKKEITKLPSATALFALLALDNFLLSEKAGFENISIIIMLFFIFCFLAFFAKGSAFEKILISMSPTVVIMPTSLLTVNTVHYLMNNKYSDSLQQIVIMVFSKLLCFAIYEVIIHLKTKRRYTLSGFQWLCLLICFAISFLIASIIWNYSRSDKNVDGEIIFIYILLIILNMMLYLLFKKIQNDNLKAMEKSNLLVSIEQQKITALELKDQFDQLQTIKHDMKHYLTVTAELINDGHKNEAKRYIEEILDEKFNTVNLTPLTGYPIVDAVIGRTKRICNEKSIAFKAEIDTEFGKLSDSDMSILLSNLLDNAIDGTENSVSPQILFTLKRVKSYLYITISNTIEKSVLDSNPELKSSKKGLHGYGLKSVKNIVELYSGTYDIYEKNEYFVSEIILKI